MIAFALLVKISVGASQAAPVVEGVRVAVVEPPVLIPVAFLASPAGRLQNVNGGNFNLTLWHWRQFRQTRGIFQRTHY